MQLFIIILAVLGYMIIVLATCISTIYVPRLDTKIKGFEKEIERLNDKINRGILYSLNYRQNEIKKRINYLELNNLIIHNSGSSEQDEIKNRIINQNIDLIKVWSKLFNIFESNEKIEVHFKKLEETLKKPGSFEDKKEELELLLAESINITNDNLKKIQKEIISKKYSKNKLEEYRVFSFKLFSWLQIIGLILLAGVVILEKVYVK